MNDEIQYLFDAMHFKFGVLIGLTAWSTSIRLVMVFVNDKIREFMEQALPAEKDGIQKFLNSFGWRALVFTVNAVASVKLPSTARKVTGDTALINKPAKPVDTPPATGG